MGQYLLIERVKVQNANAVSGFTWGFPAVTHFLGFTHNLNRKLYKETNFQEISLQGCVVIAHEQQVHTYQEGRSMAFTQYKTAQYLGLKFEKGILKDPAIVEEAKMNMTVSLLIPLSGYIGGVYEQEEFIGFLKRICLIQRLAGGTILEIKNIELVELSEPDNLKTIRNRLLPGFVLQDRSTYLEEHYLNLQKNNPNSDLLDAWFDFIALKQVARPVCDLIDSHFLDEIRVLEKLREKSQEEREKLKVLLALNDLWLAHKEKPYRKGEVPQELIEYFSTEASIAMTEKDIQDQLSKQFNKKLYEQWQNYLMPTEKTDAQWEYVRKPNPGFLVPIMVGYKAITELFPAGEVDGARDIETDLCFVESVHSIGEWQSVHRLKELADWQRSVWTYYHDLKWYLCRQSSSIEMTAETEYLLDDDAYY